MNLLFTLFLLSLAQLAIGCDLGSFTSLVYIDSTGVDSGTCTSGSPCATVSNALTQLVTDGSGAIVVNKDTTLNITTRVSDGSGSCCASLIQKSSSDPLLINNLVVQNMAGYGLLDVSDAPLALGNGLTTVITFDTIPNVKCFNCKKITQTKKSPQKRRKKRTVLFDCFFVD